MMLAANTRILEIFIREKLAFSDSYWTVNIRRQDHIWNTDVSGRVGLTLITDRSVTSPDCLLILRLETLSCYIDNLTWQLDTHGSTRPVLEASTCTAS